MQDCHTQTSPFPDGHIDRIVDQAGIRAAMADYIDNFYNTERRHSYLDNTSPAQYEKLWEDIQPIPQLS